MPRRSLPWRRGTMTHDEPSRGGRSVGRRQTLPCSELRHASRRPPGAADVMTRAPAAARAVDRLTDDSLRTVALIDRVRSVLAAPSTGERTRTRVSLV